MKKIDWKRISNSIESLEGTVPDREKHDDKVRAIQQEIASMYQDYELAVREGDDFRELAIGAWEELEEARGSTRPDLYLIEKFDVQVLRYTALATMSYSRAQAIKP